MATSSPIAASAGLAQSQATPPTAAELAKRASIAKTAKDFEGSFLSVMIGQMFEGATDSTGPFGGGQGEEMFKSFMSDAIAKQVARTGGVGIAATVQREMLKLQGLSEVTP